jgi:hypothetical protein
MQYKNKTYVDIHLVCESTLYGIFSSLFLIPSPS